MTKDAQDRKGTLEEYIHGNYKKEKEKTQKGYKIHPWTQACLSTI